MKFLLPCSCGRKLPIHASQAGEHVLCVCGADLEVPTMREIAALEQDRSEPVVSRPATRWGLRQQILLAGVVLTLAGVVLGAASYYFRPVRADIADYPPWMALHVWMVLERGIDRPPHAMETAFQEQLHTYRQWMGVAAGLAVLGVLTMAGSAVAGRIVAGRRKAGRGR